LPGAGEAVTFSGAARRRAGSIAATISGTTRAARRLPVAVTAETTPSVSAGPIWNAVFTSPPARPWSAAGPLFAAAIVSGPYASVKATPTSRNAGSIREPQQRVRHPAFE